MKTPKPRKPWGEFLHRHPLLEKSCNLDNFHVIVDTDQWVEAQQVGRERCICAAVKTTDGLVVRGHRHGDCIGTIDEMGKKPDIVGENYHEGQGFITSTGRFVTWEEGYKLQIAAGIESKAEGGYRGQRLFSEDLY